MFEREARYIVIKLKDANKYLSESDKRNLYEIYQTVKEGRLSNLKDPLECVVVESDWPEYETVWDMIQSRVEQ